MQCHRRAEADFGPVPGHRPDPLGSSAFTPFIKIDDRRFLFQKSHGGRLERVRMAGQSVGHPIGVVVDVDDVRVGVHADCYLPADAVHTVGEAHHR